MMSDNPLSTQMQALITYANETTGESDTDLSAAVGHLVDGFGGGGAAEHFTVTIDTAYTKANALAAAVLSGKLTASFKTYYAVLQKEDSYLSGQIIYFIYIDSVKGTISSNVNYGASGTAKRYKNGEYSVIPLTDGFTIASEIGDTYDVYCLQEVI